MKNFIFFILVFINISVFSQKQNIKHIVLKGESIYQIARKYNVKQDAIFKLNPSAKNKLKLNSILLIPNSKVEIENVFHDVLPKETLYGISKKYRVSIDDIKLANPIIEKEGLEIGLKLVIPNGNKVSQQLDKLEEVEEITHVVLPKETKYGLSKKYNTTIADLEKLNPQIVNDLPVGLKIIIRNGVSTNKNLIVDNDKSLKNRTEPEQQKPNTITEDIIVKDSIISDKNKDVLVQPVKIDSVTTTQPNLENLAVADKLVYVASENIGTRYRSGGTQKGGFDCSGLIIYTYRDTDVKLPRTSNEMSRFGENVTRENAQKGDLIFFSTNGTGNVNHVGMVTEVLEDEIKFIHASVHAGVIISSTKEAYYAKRFVKVNRVLE